MCNKPTFFELADQVDKLIPVQAPTPKQIEEAVRLIADEALEQYFFNHLAISENPGWFEPLRQQDFFDAPPDPIKRGGAISYPMWPPLWYLIAIAPKCPEKVVKTAEELYTRHHFIMLDLVYMAQRMPPECAARTVPLIVRWADEGMNIAEGVVSLADYLAQAEQWEAALTLVDLLLSPKEPQVSEEAKQSPSFFHRAVSKAEKYFAQEFAERHLTPFLEHYPLEVLHIAQRNLERAIEIETRGDDASSSGWRPAIEPHEQNWEHGIKDILVDVAVQTLGHVTQNTSTQARMILETYLNHCYSIFRRLAIHTIRLNADFWPALVEYLFTEPQYLEDIDLYHEYWMLMHDLYDSLPTPAQREFLARILAKLPPKQVEPTLQYHMGRHWVIRRLWAIKDSRSFSEHQVLAELVSEYGEPDHPSFLSYSSELAGSVSPKLPEELGKLSPEEILAELKKRLPFESFDGPSQEGLANALKTAIANLPQHLTPIAPGLLEPDIPPIYTYHALWGFREAWRDKSFDWDPVLKLCDKVSRTKETTTEAGKPADLSSSYWMTTYASARSAVADLIEVGVVRDDHAIPPELLGYTRDILLVLVDDPNPSPEYEQARIAEHSFGVLDLALNVTRGKAIEALLQYALHVVRINSREQETGKTASLPESLMEAAVRDKLTQKLNKQTDPSLAVHSLFGKYFPNLCYLDKEWALAHLEDIFPRQPEMTAYWEAAWDGYMFRGDFFGYLYENLKPYYRYAIEQMALGSQGKAGSNLSCGRLARHLAAIYWRGIETLQDSHSLVPLFFNSAPDEVRAGFVIGLGVALREVKPVTDSEEWLRAKVLWEARSRTIEEATEWKEEQLASFAQELAAFVDWIPFIPENLGNFYSLIESSVIVSGKGRSGELIRFLSSVAADHASFVVSLLEKLVQKEQDRWFLIHEGNAVRAMLEAAMTSDDEQAKLCAVRVINLFGQLGNERYRDLLKLR